MLDEVIAARQVDGFVLSDVLEGDARVAHVARAGVPLVTFGRVGGQGEAGVGDSGDAWVDVDNAAAVTGIVEHLAGVGHRRMVYLGSETGLPWMRERREGFRRAVAALGVEAREAVAPLDDPGAVVGVVRGVLAATARPTAIVAESDSLAVAAYEAVRSSGLTVGVHVAVTGFGDAPVARVLHPGLTSVRLPLRAIGGEIVRRLVAQVRGGWGRRRGCRWRPRWWSGRAPGRPDSSIICDSSRFRNAWRLAVTRDHLRRCTGHGVDYSTVVGPGRGRRAHGPGGGGVRVGLPARADASVLHSRGAVDGRQLARLRVRGLRSVGVHHH
ncbi:substrate-binding domain-containing protein [Catenulispora yoronensis]